MRDDGQQASGETAAPIGFKTWNAYWTAQGMPWRTEPEIDEERKDFLAKRRSIRPLTWPDIFPFRGIHLGRADVEWLLATHESKGLLGPVDWTDEKQHERWGLDLRGACLQGAQLENLPLARLLGGYYEWDFALFDFGLASFGRQLHDTDPRTSSAIHLEGAFLYSADLRGSRLGYAHLEGGQFMGAQLDEVMLIGAHLEGASFTDAHMGRARLGGAHLEGSYMIDTHLEGADFATVGVSYDEISKDERLEAASLSGCIMQGAHLEGADLRGARLAGKQMAHDDVKRIRKWVDEFPEILPPANLTQAYFDKQSNLANVVLCDGISLADVQWGNVNVTGVDWTGITVLGEEHEARKRQRREWNVEAEIYEWKDKEDAGRLLEYQTAVRAYRQLTKVLREQGLDEDADNFAYRGYVLQREVLRRQGKWRNAFGSWLLDAVAGYGYEPKRSIITYLLVVGGFAVLYFLMRESVHPALNPVDAVIFSITSFHGRGFNPGESVTLHNPLTILASIEAIVGLLIEITFIATFTQRFFAH